MIDVVAMGERLIVQRAGIGDGERSGCDFARRICILYPGALDEMI